MQPLYQPATDIMPGDILPTVSRAPITSVTVFPNESVRVVTANGFIRHFPYGGPDFGYESVRIERPDPETPVCTHDGPGMRAGDTIPVDGHPVTVWWCKGCGEELEREEG